VRKSWTMAIAALCGLALFFACTERSQTQPSTRVATASAHNFAQWEKEIAAFEKSDKEKMPAKGGVLFIGSSTIRMWKTLAEDFPGVAVINRGLGGSEIVDATHFVQRIVLPYAPKAIYFRAGGNDLHAGKSAERVFEDYKEFVVEVHEKLPMAEIVYISQSPAPVRWSERDATKALNDLVKEYTKQYTYLKYIETYDISVAADGKAREELFLSDKLHFNAEGYKLLAERVRPLVTGKGVGN
jgi:lysophospholipase L1-like esterase